MHISHSLMLILALVVMSISALPLPMVRRDSQTVRYETVPQSNHQNNLVSSDFGSTLDTAKNEVYYEGDDEDFDHEDDSDHDDRSTTTTTTAATTTATTSSSSTTSSTTTKKATTTTASAKPTTDSSSSGSHSGRGTWYTPDLGSCGKTNSADDMVVAINYIDMANGANSNNNPKCGKKIKISYQGKSTEATISLQGDRKRLSHKDGFK
ncbi:hypothetical protein [Absidia glauca]|uniref:RlpA-like protein double-psi beta-barrel domain-containing protein n=1 Tax=Absidia glauca TaxID=4829 RepID=A0A168SAK6_ABSGL|nr:hypothetical protein [Absidia glauca]